MLTDGTSHLILRSILGRSDAELTATDPLVMNLTVAREIPDLEALDVNRYVQMADGWAVDIARRLPGPEREFHRTPQDWKNDLAFFRLGFVCWYVDEVLGIRYREDQKFLNAVSNTDASDLFLHGVMDTLRGTCANMAALHVLLGWRLGWPVSLACVASHFVCRYDDGKVTHNIEATKNGGGGFHSHPDDYYIKECRLPRKALTCGSDLRALTPREVLGVFVGLRARHFVDTNRHSLAESDYLLARHLFPNNRRLHFAQMMASVQHGADLFEPHEAGHPVELADWLEVMVEKAGWFRPRVHQKEPANVTDSDAELAYTGYAALRCGSSTGLEA